jgi:predicted ester cyclase
MAAKENKERIRQLFAVLNDQVWPKGNLNATDDFIAPDYVYHDAGGPRRGREGFRELITLYRTAFPDARFTVEDQIAEGDQVLTRFSVRGTQRGAFMGIAPTGKPVTVSVLSLTRVANGKAVEEWERFDTLQMMQQIGELPALAQSRR